MIGAICLFSQWAIEPHKRRARTVSPPSLRPGATSTISPIWSPRCLEPPARLLYLTGEDRSGDLAGTLRAQSFVVDMVVVYRAVVAETLPAEAAAALTRGIDGVLHYSRRSAETYVNAARGAGLLASALKPIHFCLSAQVAEPLAQAGAADIRIAPRPAETDLIGLIPSP